MATREELVDRITKIVLAELSGSTPPIDQVSAVHEIGRAHV